ncbi:MAG: hypothetical protein Kow0092_01710 [Deferrisomatales bacterium]
MATGVAQRRRFVVYITAVVCQEFVTGKKGGCPMRKPLTLVVACAVAVLGLGAAWAVEMPQGPVSILTDGAKKPAVSFDHSLHMEKNPELKDNCQRCHHKGTDSVDHMKCRNCHGIKAEGDKPKIKDAMHKRGKGKCYACHFPKDAKKKLKCNNCHKK